MDSNLLRVAGQIAGIGGLALGAFLILSREIIRKKIFPSLSKAHAFRLLLFLAFAAWSVALAGISAWVVTSRPNPQSGAPDSQVRLVDLNAHFGNEFARLDVKLRNTGQNVAFLKTVELSVIKVWNFELPIQADAEPASWNYDVELPLKGAPYKVSLPISQRIKPNDTDRFTLTLANDDGFGEGTVVYLLECRIVYDEDNKQVSSKPILVRSNGRWMIEAAYVPGGEFAKKVHEHNMAFASEIAKLNALRGEGVDELLGNF